MEENREKNMRSQLGDYSMAELIDLCVNLQDVIDDHVREKTGLKASNDAMAKQLPALQARNDELESQMDDYLYSASNSEEMQKLREDYDALRKRNDELTELNEGLQRKLIGD